MRQWLLVGWLRVVDGAREGWCSRGGTAEEPGHVDGPDKEDYGACGSKWVKQRFVSPWVEVEEHQ